MTTTEAGDWVEVRSPYSNDLVGRIPRHRADDARRAIDAAVSALGEPLPAFERAAILERAAALLHAAEDEAARTLCAEAGKPMKAARAEVGRASSTLIFAAAEARKLAGEVVPMDASAAGIDKLAFTLRRPIGVVGAISPFNFPLNLVAHKVGPALAAGCPVVLKPASQTPMSAVLLADLLSEAGLPPGWLTVVVGSSGEIGDVLVEDDRVKLITFTGSGPVGWRLAERSPRKRVKLELGNATPVIVQADADLDAAAAKCVTGAFAFAGQSCISVQRIYVARDAFDTFTARLVSGAEALVVGDPSDETTDVGPVISRTERERILAWIAGSGGTLLTGGTVDANGVIAPTVISHPASDSDVSCDEAFGPVCTVTAVDSLDEAIEHANATRYGLQAGIFTADLRAALRAATELEFGGVTVNEVPTWRTDQMPYGGVKDSGNTKEGPAWAIREMTDERLVVLDLQAAT